MDLKKFKSFIEHAKKLSPTEAAQAFSKEREKTTAERAKMKEDKLYTPRGTLKEGAYLRAKAGDQYVHEDEVAGALEHAKKEGDDATAKKLERAQKDIQTGEHGGHYYVGPGGKKVYVKDY